MSRSNRVQSSSVTVSEKKASDRSNRRHGTRKQIINERNLHLVCDDTDDVDRRETFIGSHRNAASREKIQKRARKTGDRMSVNHKTGDGIHENRDGEFDDELSRTIQIVNVHKGIKDFVELKVEHKTSGGGDYEKCEYDSKRQNLTVVFTDAEGLRNTSLFYLRFTIVFKC